MKPEMKDNARGFGAMTPEQRRAYGKIGGTKAHATGAIHVITEAERMKGSSKGGKAAQARRRAEKALAPDDDA